MTYIEEANPEKLSIGKRDHKAIWIFGAMALSLALMAGASWATLIRNAQRSQPLLISACMPDTECQKWFPVGAEPWPVNQPIRVTGERCNSSGKAVAYNISIAWESITSPAAFPVVEARASWPPGCEFYDFTFEVPLTMRALLDEGDGTLGRWKLIGDANPVNTSLYRPYTWDVTGAVELVAAE